MDENGTATVGVDTQPHNFVIDGAAGDHDSDPRTDRIAGIINSYVYVGGFWGPHIAAARVLADDELRAGLRALDVVAQLDRRHQPVRWAPDSPTVVCSCGHGSYDHCPDGLILRGEA